jgi:hypothetical protein
MRYFVGFVIATLLLIFIIFMLFFGGGSSSTSKDANTVKALSEYAKVNSSVRLSISGPITADETHQGVTVSVSSDNATITVTQGYNGTVTSERTYQANQNGYTSFMTALQFAGFDAKVASAFPNEIGHCAQGSRYVFELFEGSKTVQRTWTASCSKVGSFNGSLERVLNLFQAQIPDYNEITQNVQI